MANTDPAAPGLAPAPGPGKGEPYALRLARFGAGLEPESMPEAVRSHARRLLLDLLGAALAGADTEEGRAVRAAARAVGDGGGPCTLWGTGAQAGAALAALVNGTTAHAQELDDFGGADHSGAVVVPAVLAAAEREGLTDGAQVLAAMVVGYDVALRVLEAAGGYRAHNNDGGWHSTGTCGSFGAAAAAARVLGLDARRTAWALGLAGSFTGGIWAYIADGAMSKRYHAGRAAEVGLTAAYLAREGFTGPERIFEAPWGGFLPTYCGASADPERLVAGLGEDWKILASGIKPYAACRGIHAALDVVLDLRTRHRLAVEDVARVEVRGHRRNLESLWDPDPRTRLAAQMSLPYSLAVAMVSGRALLEEYEPRRLEDPAVRAMLGRVEMHPDSDMGEWDEPVVIVETRAGARHEGHQAHGRGAPENPLSDEEVVAKYRTLAARALGPAEVAALEAAALGIDTPGALPVLLGALARGRVHA